MKFILYITALATLCLVFLKGKDMLVYYTALQEAKTLQPSGVGRLLNGDCRIRNTLEAINKNLFIVVGEHAHGKHIWAVDNPYLANSKKDVVDKTSGIEKEKIHYSAYAIYKLNKDCTLRRIATIRNEPEVLHINELYISTFCKKVKEKYEKDI